MAIVKANAELSSGNLAVIRREFTASNDGVMLYSVEYCCLAPFAEKWTQSFQVGSSPPTPLPSNITRLRLTKNPQLVSLQTETNNGLTFFSAEYSAGLETSLVLTHTSETRTISWVIGYKGTTRIVASFDYISNSYRVAGTNRELPIVNGTTGIVSNAKNVDAAAVMAGSIASVRSGTVVTSSRSHNFRGEYTNEVTSSGIYIATDAEQPPVWGAVSGSSASSNTSVSNIQNSRPVVADSSSTQPKTWKFYGDEYYALKRLAGVEHYSTINNYYDNLNTSS